MPQPKWIQERKAEIEKQQEEYNKTKGKYFKFPQGETKVLIDINIPPQKRTSRFGTEQWMYHAKINNEDKLITVNVILDRAIIQALSEEINPMTIIRVGTDKNTRYTVKELVSS